MKLLLDTHIALWALAEPARLPLALAERLADGQHDIFVSIVSVWEVAIKHAIVRPDGQRKLDLSPTQLLGWLDEIGFSILPLRPEHCVHAAALPYRSDPANGRLHGDPFDRMLVAQALAEPLRLVTADPLVALHLPDAGGLIEAMVPLRRQI